MKYLEKVGSNARKAFENLKAIKHNKIQLVLKNYNTAILPETNFIFQLLSNKKFSKEEILKKIYSEKKFKDLRIKKFELKKIIYDNYQNYEKIINEIICLSNIRIYGCKSKIGLKKNAKDK